MQEEITILEIIRVVLFYASPPIFIVGLLLLIAEYRYRKLEELLGKEIGGIRRITIPRLETTIYAFQERLLSMRIVVGLILIIFSVAFFFVFRG